ncbi:MAG TPA: FAD-binding and (Fe-S)-binding domain-containing protein [Solirubrobacteraceae bacterium]
MSSASLIAPETAQPSADRAPDWVATGTPEPLQTQLAQALGADRVLTRASDLVMYASDASPYRMIPKAIAMPRDVDDVVKLLAFARAERVPLVFRAGGTSLNGQAQTDSVLVDVRRHWQRARVLDDGARVRVRPGIVVGQVNRLLARHGRKLGPDPASSDIACVGGVIANNSGGMRCGVVADSYRTVRSMTLVLANGEVIDTAAPDAEQRFAAAAPELASGLIEIRDELRADRELAERVARKFEIKNTMGYRLCAFLDADEPLEIFRRLVIGSEGTLAFVAEAEFETVPFGSHAAVALVFFPDLDAAASAVGDLVAFGASATELMIAPTLIAAAYNMPGTPERWKTLPPESAALLVEFRAAQASELDEPEQRALEFLAARELVDEPRFSREREQIEMLWHVREGMQGLVAAFRPPGVALIVEDVCVPPARLAEAAKDLQALLTEHGFLPGLAGHASAGNFHFLLTPNFTEPADLERYDKFMTGLTDLIVDKYDGSLKAEHGTGVNMAPHVEREWGSKATELMWRIKQLADPDGILGPGVVLNRDPGVHLRNLKSTPEIEEVATKCIECGFCEPVCPSRNVTTTPRQRIVLRREMARQEPGSPVLDALLEQYEYDAIDTCAADGSCMTACPVAIDTGALVKQLRVRRHSAREEQVGRAVAGRYAAVERATRAGLRVGGSAARVWRSSIPAAAPELPFTVREGAAAVYLPSCLNRIFGNAAGASARPSVPQALVAISQRAGMPLWIPDDVAGHCCGLPWSSKGYARGHELMASRTSAALRRWTDGGRLPVVTDATSCSHALVSEVEPDGVDVIDSIAWVHDRLLERLEIPRKLSSVVVHPTCSARHLGLTRQLAAIASRLADDVVVPVTTGCCGMAGDRGWLRPELPASALRDVTRELDGQSFDACVSSNRTCEIALQQVTGRQYASFVLTLEQLTRG